MLNRAALVVSPGRIEITEIEIGSPREGEVILRMKAAGVCATDYKVAAGSHSGKDSRYPMLLSHEGAGVVEEVGPGVTHLKEGDRVAVGCRVPCGACSMCRRNEPRRCRDSSPRAPQVSLASDGSPVEVPMGLGMFAERIGVDAQAAFRISDGMPMTSASLLGCAVMTGTGAVLNIARVWPGATTAVIGCGGIGLSAVQGARIANASKVIAVDLSDRKLEWARELGATHVVNSASEDPVEAVRSITGGAGVDFSFEAVGARVCVEQCLEMLAHGGVATLIGGQKPGVMATFDPAAFSRRSLTLQNTHGGGGIPAHDFPVLDSLYQQGSLDLDAMVTHAVPLTEAAQGFRNLEEGSAIRSVVVPD